MNENTSVEKPNVRKRQKINYLAIASFVLAVLGSIPWIYVIDHGMLDPSGGSYLFSSARVQGNDYLFQWIVCGAPMMALAAIVLGLLALVQIIQGGKSQKGIPLAIYVFLLVWGILIATSQICLSGFAFILPKN